jgi:hypothetical protein
MPAVIHSSGAAQGGRRAALVGDAAVAAAEHQHLDQLVEHDPVSDAGAVAAQGMGVGAGGQQGSDLDPQRFQDREGGPRLGAALRPMGAATFGLQDYGRLT